MNELPEKIQEAIEVLKSMGHQAHAFAPFDNYYQNDAEYRAAVDALEAAIKQKLGENKPLTQKQLSEMDRQPGWCKELQCWGLISVGFKELNFVWTAGGCSFEYDITARKLTIYAQPV